MPSPLAVRPGSSSGAHRASGNPGSSESLSDRPRPGVGASQLRGLELSADLAYGSLGQALSRAVPREIIEDWPEPERSALLTIVPERREDSDAGAPRKPLLAFATDVGLRAGLVAAARRLAAERPLVIAVDDLQWLDQASLALLGSLQSVEGPLLLLGTLRDEPRPADHAADLRRCRAPGRRHGAGARTARTPRDRVAPGARSRGTALGRDVADSIAELADGAPLYALELLRTAQETGTISLRDGEWRRTAPADGLPVPHGVRRAVEARMARLAPTVRSILTVAAELGDEVSFELLVAASAEPPATVLDALDEGLALALLQEQAGRYRRHPLFRAALRRDIPPRSRATLHGRIATALRRDVDPRDQAAISAATAPGPTRWRSRPTRRRPSSSEQSRRWKPRSRSASPAVPASATCSTLPGASRRCGRRSRCGIGCLLEVRGSFPASAAHHRLGLALKGLGDNVAAAEAFGGEIATAATDMDRARGYAALSWLPYEHGQFDRAEALLRTGIASVSDSVPRAYLQSGLGWIRGRHGDWAAAHELLREAVPVLEPEAPPAILARALDRFAVSIRDTGEPGRAVPVFERAFSLALQAADAHEEAMVRMHFAGALRELGDLEAARDHLVRALATCRLTGDRYIEAVSLWVLAEVEDSAGRLDEAIECRRRELEILRGIGGNPQNEALARAHISHLAARAGDDAMAAAEAQLARDRAAHAGLDHLPALVERGLGGGRLLGRCRTCIATGVPPRPRRTPLQVAGSSKQLQSPLRERAGNAAARDSHTDVGAIPLVRDPGQARGRPPAGRAARRRGPPGRPPRGAGRRRGGGTRRAAPRARQRPCRRPGVIPRPRRTLDSARRAWPPSGTRS